MTKLHNIIIGQTKRFNSLTYDSNKVHVVKASNGLYIVSLYLNKCDGSKCSIKWCYKSYFLGGIDVDEAFEWAELYKEGPVLNILSILQGQPQVEDVYCMQLAFHFHKSTK